MKKIILYLQSIIQLIFKTKNKKMENLITFLETELKKLDNTRVAAILKLVVTNLTNLLNYVTKKTASFVLTSTGNATIDEMINAFATIGALVFPDLPATIQSLIDTITSWAADVEADILLAEELAAAAGTVAATEAPTLVPSHIALVKKLNDITVTANPLQKVMGAAKNAQAIQSMVTDAMVLVNQIPAEIAAKAAAPAAKK
jgi:hypothetical protein